MRASAQPKDTSSAGGAAAAPSAPSPSGSTGTTKGAGGLTAADYLSPFSAVDPAMRPPGSTSSSSSEASTSSSSSGQDAGGGGQPQDDADPWSEVLATKHTLSSLYLQKFEVEPVKQRDWEARRRTKDLAEVTQAGARLGIAAATIQDNLAQLEGLVPGLVINLDRMKASDWAKLLRDVDEVVAVVISLKGHYPKLDVGDVIRRRPRLLLATRARVDEDAAQVKALLGPKVQDVDAIIGAVPDLMSPQQLEQSLASLASWFPGQDPFALLQQNPTILEAPNVEADPTYGSSFW